MHFKHQYKRIDTYLSKFTLRFLDEELATQYKKNTRYKVWAGVLLMLLVIFAKTLYASVY